MAQISYGTITIIDTNDIESIIIEYARNQSTSSAPDSQTGGWSTTRPTWAQGYYIWQRTRIHKTGTSDEDDEFGTAVCITGSTGQIGVAGRSLIGTATQYTTAISSATINENNMENYTWSDNVPTYNSNYPAYWVRITNTYDATPLIDYIIYKDNGISDAIATAAAANTTANNAWDKADNAEDIAQQAADDLNSYMTNNDTAVTALQTRTRYFWDNLVVHYNGINGWTKPDYLVGTYTASGIDNVTFDEENSSTYGYNTLYANGIKLRYNAINLAQLTGSSLIFYKPSITSQGGKAMELSNSTLKFYNPSNDSISMMDLTSSGLTFKTAAGAEIGTFGANGLDMSGSLNIRGGGRIGQDSSNYWEFGDNRSYKDTDSAYLMGIGNASLQLGESGYWRLDKDRIHTGWYQLSDSTRGILHFDTGAENDSTYYWDYGMHYPGKSSNPTGNNKFLYVRRSTDTTSTTLATMKSRVDDDTYWVYKFWVDGDGNVHAPGFFIGNSATPIGGGTGTIAEKLTQGYGSSNRPIYIQDTGVPATITVTDNSSATAVSSTDTNLITARTLYYAGYVKSSGVTSITLTQGTGISIGSSGTAITSTGSRTIALADNYGDSKNPYASKTKNYVLAAPSTTDGVPSFRLLVASDIPDLSGTYLTSHQTVTNKAATLAWGSSKTVATIGSTDITVSLPSNPNSNTTYTFTDGTNGFTVTPSGGTAQTVMVTPSITNNVTGTGTSGSLAKWNGAHTLTDGPAFSSGGTGFLKEDGTWGTPGGTYSLPTAKYNTLGGVKPAYSSTNAATLTTAAATNTTTPTIAAKTTTSGRYYGVEADKNGILFVNVPWTNVNSSYLISESDPIFSASAAANITSSDITNWNGKTSNTGTVTSVKVQGSNGLTGSGTVTTSGTITISHDDTSSQASSSNSGRTYVQSITLDTYGHVTGISTASETVTDTHNTAYLYAGASNGSTNAQTTNGNTYLILVDGGSATTRRKISGSGTVSVASDSSGNITITGTAHPSTLPNPNALSLKLFNETTARAQASQGTPTSTVSYDGSTANQSIEVAGRNAITTLSASAASGAGGATTFTYIKADGSSGTFDVTVNAAISTNATKLTDSNGNTISTTGSTVPVWFNSGVPQDVTGIAFSLLPTGTGSSQVAIGNHTHTISLASDTGTTGVVSLSHGGKYKLTAGGNSVIFTLPTDNNTDTKVKLTSQSTSGTYPLIFGPTSITTGTAYEVFYNTGITVNPNTSTITATTFNGNASTATTASKLGTADKGSSTKPIYLSSGSPTECSTYAGGTAVTLNGTSKAASTASFYAPTSAGTANYVLIADANGIPTWTAQSNITSGNSDEKLAIAAVTSGTQYYPIVAADSTAAATRQYDKTGFTYKGTNGTTSTVGSSILVLGNSTGSGTANNKQAQLVMYGSNTKKATITLAAPSADIALALPTSGGTLALTSQIPTVPTSTGSSTTGISIADHGTTSIGSASGWSAGTASSWVFEEISIPNVTSAGSASTWSFTDVTVPIRADSDTTVPTAASSATACDDITSWSAGSGSATLTFAINSSDSSQLDISFSHTHTAPSLSYTARSITGVSGSTTVRGVKTGTSSTTTASKASGANGTAPTIGTAIKVQSKKSGSNSTVPSLTVTSTTVVSGKSHSITDNGHTHTI